MANGNTHDRAGAITAAVTTILVSQLVPAPLTITYCAFSVLGFTHLGPDLDDHSFQAATIRRWGPLRPLWRPFNRMVRPHRGPTHCPYTGPLWALEWLIRVIVALWLPGLALGLWEWPSTINLALAYPFAVAVYSAMLIQYWVHLAFDGILVKRLLFRK